METPEANKQFMRRFVEFINTASEKLAAELIAPEVVFYVPGRPEPMRGPAGYLAIVAMGEASLTSNGRWKRWSPRGTRWPHGSP